MSDSPGRSRVGYLRSCVQPEDGLREETCSYGSVNNKDIHLRKSMSSCAYTGCPRRNVPDTGRVFLMLKYTDITQNTYIQS